MSNNNLIISKAKSFSDFLFLRKLRNEVRLNMTNINYKITIWAQIKFFLNQPNNLNIYIARIEGIRAGYLLLREDNGNLFITEAVDQNFRNQGIATEMIKFAKNLKIKLIAEILNSNNASIFLHEKSGFVKISKNHTISTYLLEII